MTLKQLQEKEKAASQTTSPRCKVTAGLTFVLRRELLHFWRQGLIEALLPGDERLADGVVVVAHHAAVAAHLVNERLQQHPPVSRFSGILAILAHFHGLTNTHCVGHQLNSWSMGRATKAGRCSSAALRQPGFPPLYLLPCNDLERQTRVLWMEKHLYSCSSPRRSFWMFLYICKCPSHSPFTSHLFQHAPHHLFNRVGKHMLIWSLSLPPPVGLTGDRERRRSEYPEAPIFTECHFLPSAHVTREAPW